MRTRILHLALATASILGGTGAAVATASPAAAGTCGVDMSCEPDCAANESCPPTPGTCGWDMSCWPESTLCIGRPVIVDSEGDPEGCG